MKRLIIISIIILLAKVSFAQDVKKEAESIKTKMEIFTSKTGTIIKFINTNLPVLKTRFGTAETKIRKIINGNTTAYFYVIEKEGKYDTSSAFIEYSDLIEVIKALQVLKSEIDEDIALNPDYMENKFVTEDGLQVGYYIMSGKPNWYIKLEKYGSDNTLFIQDGNIIEKAFTDAKNKIDELKQGE